MVFLNIYNFAYKTPIHKSSHICYTIPCKVIFSVFHWWCHSKYLIPISQSRNLLQWVLEHLSVSFALQVLAYFWYILVSTKMESRSLSITLVMATENLHMYIYTYHVCIYICMHNASLAIKVIKKHKTHKLHWVFCSHFLFSNQNFHNFWDICVNKLWTFLHNFNVF